MTNVSVHVEEYLVSLEVRRMLSFMSVCREPLSESSRNDAGRGRDLHKPTVRTLDRVRFTPDKGHTDCFHCGLAGF